MRAVRKSRAVALVKLGAVTDPAGLPVTNKLRSDNDGQLPLLLVAEDNADDLFFLRRLLAKAEVKNPILAFTDGGKAIEFLQQIAAGPESPTELPCILLLDIRM